MCTRIIVCYIYIIYMKGPNPKSRICNDFVRLAFSVIEALKNIQIDACLRYLTVLQLNIYIYIIYIYMNRWKPKGVFPAEMAHLLPYEVKSKIKFLFCNRSMYSWHMSNWMILSPYSHENDLIKISAGNTPFGFHRFIYILKSFNLTYVLST